MITMKELLRNYDYVILPIEHRHNLDDLLEVMNQIRAKYGKPMTITSGYRSKQDQIRIYKEKAASHQFPFASGVYNEAKVPFGSKHLTGLACDIYDASGSLMGWCRANESFLRSLPVWLENRMGPWVHFQIVPYRSYKTGGSLWFNP